MKFFTGSLVAGLVLLAGSAQAQGPGRYMAASDVESPYVVGPRVVIPPPYEAGPRYGYGPRLLPSTEVYAVLRDNGFSPLGIPRLRGFVYTIAALNRDGSGGRLVIDARDGRILRFMPRRWGSDNFDEEQSALPRPVPGPLGAPPPQAPPPQAQAPQAQSSQAHGTDPSAARPSRPAQVATRTVPMPKASPVAAKPAPAAPAPVQQAAAPAPAPKSAEAQAPAAAPTDAAAAKPAPAIAPTEEMPKPQGLE